MDRSTVSDLYEKYKLGTRRVIRWLSETALHRCAASTELPAVYAKLQDTTASNDGKRSNVVVLTTRELLELAQAISSAAGPKQAPPKDVDSIKIILGEVISTRREYSKWYEQKAVIKDQTYQQQNASHLHFINVLQDILELLRSAWQDTGPSHVKRSNAKKKGGKKATVARKPSAPHSEDLDNALSNIYSGLTLEETRDELTNDLPRPEKATEASGKPSDILFELEDLQNEKSFALYCFLTDCSAIRTYLRNLWGEYCSGRISIQVAAEVTNIAFQLMNQTATEFIRDFPVWSSFDKIAEGLEIRVTLVASEVRKFTYKESLQAGDSLSQTDAAAILCLPAFSTLAMVREMRSTCAHDVDRFIKTVRHLDAAHTLARSILDAFEELNVLHEDFARYVDFHGCDEFTNDMVHLMGSNVLDVRMVVRFQAYMEIVDILGDMRGSHVPPALTLAEGAKTSIEGFRRKLPELQDIGLFQHTTNLDSLRSLCVRLVTRTFEEPVIERRSWDVGTKGEALVARVPGLLCDFPVLCGWLAQRVAVYKHIDGVLLCNEGRILTAVAHLYNSCKRSGLLKLAWPDMEFCIKHHGSKGLGIRDVPTHSWSLTAAARHYGLALGVDLKQFVKPGTKGNRDSRQPLPDPHSGRAAEVCPTSHYHTTVYETNAATRNLELTSDRKATIVLHQLARRLLNDERQPVAENIRKQWMSCQKLTPTELLSVLQSTLETDDLQLSFDYHSLYTFCALLLQDIKRKYSSRLGAELRGYEVVDEILWEAAEAVKISGPTLRNTTILSGVSRYLTEFIQRRGSVFLEHTKQLASGSIVDDFHPRTIERRPAENHQPNELAVSMINNKIELTPMKLDLTEKEKQARDIALEWQRNNHVNQSGELNSSH